ncbi:MAG TPA: superoxide dismutase family protein [Longimicrobium sp.]
MRYASAIVCCCLAAAACRGDDRPDETAAAPAIDSAVAGITGDTVRDTTNAVGDTTVTATAVMQDAAGKELGTVTLTDAADGIAVSGAITGLPPGEHGFHVHAVGQCAPPFESAGPHWNPSSKQHGTLNPAGPHAGDLGNLNVGPAGTVTAAGTTRGGRLSELLDADGAALVVHEKVDDYRTDPSGNSGARIACGVIQRAP